MINHDDVITDGTTYYMEGNISQGEECEYVATSSENQLQVYGNERPEENGVFLAELQPGSESNWAFKDSASALYLVRNEENNNAEATSPEPVYFSIVNIEATDVYNISQETPAGDELYLSMLNSEEGSPITFSEYEVESQAKQKWKFVKTKGGADIPRAYGD